MFGADPFQANLHVLSEVCKVYCYAAVFIILCLYKHLQWLIITKPSILAVNSAFENGGYIFSVSHY